MKTIKIKLIFTVLSIFIVMMIATLVTGILSARFSIKVNVRNDLVFLTSSDFATQIKCASNLTFQPSYWIFLT